MILIIGLGNPCPKYDKTRHNLGQWLIDGLREQWQVYDFGDWTKENKLKSETSKGNINSQKVILAKPLTYMNNSGSAVSLLKHYYHIEPENIWIIHDDIDLPLGKIKIAKDRGAAGHKGIRSIISAIGTKNFVRFRIGIGAEQDVNKSFILRQTRLTANFLAKIVLKKFNRNEKKILASAKENVYRAIELAVKEKIEKAMNQFN